MAGEAKKEKGLLHQIGEGMAEVTKKVLVWLLPFVIAVAIILKAIDTIAPKIGFDTPFGRVQPITESHLFDQFMAALQEFVWSLITGTLAVLFWPVVIIVVLLFVFWFFFKWEPKKDEPKIYQRIMNWLAEGLHAGVRKGGELTAKGARRAAAEIKKKRIEAGKCPSCGASRPKGAQSCAYCGRQFVAPRPAGGRALKFEFRRWSWTIRLPGQAKPVAQPAVQPAPPLPPETLTEPGLSVSEAPVEIAEDFPIEQEADEFRIEEDEEE